MENIENLTDERVWFRNNVFFILSTGCIFSDDDKRMLDLILSYFKPSSSNYLENKILLTNYEDDSMKAIEKKLLIENGNYHVCLIVGVYNSACLENAPEEHYARKGLITYYMSWKEVSDAFVEMISKYGFRQRMTIPKGQTALDDIILDHEVDKVIAIQQELDEYNSTKEKQKIKRQGYAERIRNDNIDGIVPTIEFTPIQKQEEKLEVPNKVYFYEDEHTEDLDGMIGRIL